MNVDLAIARQCLRFASRAYVEKSLESVGTSTQVLIGGLLDDPSALVIAFRGSHELKDYLQDARFIAKTPWVNGGVIAQAVKVHRGFSECYFSVANQIRERAAQAQRIYVTGHSLGGALALMCALDLKQHGAAVAAVHTFGCPRVGNGAWRNLYDVYLNPVTLRWEAQGDFVPYGPPWLNGYRSVGRECYLPNVGGVKIEQPIWNHIVPASQAVLDKWLPNLNPLAAPNQKLVGIIRRLARYHGVTNYDRLFAQLKESA